MFRAVERIFAFRVDTIYLILDLSHTLLISQKKIQETGHGGCGGVGARNDSQNP